MTTDKRTITAEDLYRFELVTDPQLSSDGNSVVFCQQWTERESEKKYTNLWVAAVGDGDPRRFTIGDHTDSHPRWSPDGQQIAFLSNRDDEKQHQIYLIPFHGGEARKLTDFKGTIAQFSWSPDGSKLLCQFRKKDPDAIERDEDEKKNKLGIVARHITRADFRFDGAGWVPQERWHIWSVDAETGEPTQLTDGEYHETSPIWSPDGASVYYLSNRSERPDMDPDLEDLFRMPAAGGEGEKLVTPIGRKSGLGVSPDGKWLSYTSTEGKGNWWRNTGLWVLPADGSELAKNLTATTDLDFGNSTLGDVADRSATPPAWSADNTTLYAQVSRHGRTSLYSVTRDGTVAPVFAPDGVISDFTFDHERQKMAYIWSNFDDPGQIWSWDTAEEDRQQLTRVNEDWLAAVDLGSIEEVWFKGADDNDLQGWILKPPGFDAQNTYPSILEIHGGPWTQYGQVFMHEFYLLAANGYVVYFSNPRGGQGYGEEHARAIHHKWGDRDYADVMAWADTVAALPYIDTERMGVTGGSYGGYMTAWIIGHTNRFQAAVAQRVVSNAISFWGSSDVGILFEDPWADRQPPWENFEAYWRQSPMAYVGNATTPTLVVHSEQDMRCNPEQGTQLFLALRRLGVDTEMVIFPEESHGLSRSGRTDRRIARLEHFVRWFDRYLKMSEAVPVVD
jgi:dipeptidyl aminopeptidase/acylaminoacyl peptidase